MLKYGVIERIGGVFMLVKILSIVMIVVSIVLTTLVLLQEGKSAGLGAIGGGSTDTYWGKNKGRSKEGKLELLTKILAFVFFVLAAILASKWVK